MKLHISKGNTKLGKIPNISLPPVVTCRKGVWCTKDCYAMKAYRLWPEVKTAWDENWLFYKKDSRGYFDGVQKWLQKNAPNHFRWHVSGDIPTRDYFLKVVKTARMFPDIRFMLFTKRWDMLPDGLCGNTVTNLAVILSMWPGAPAPKRFGDLPKAWLSHDRRLPDYYFKCPGKCDECYACWDVAKLGWNVVFDLH